jgi:hypothetical protein
MKYLDVINNCKLKIDKEFNEFALTLKNNKLFSKLNSRLSSYSFVNEFQLVDITLSFYVPEVKNSDEDGIDISIGLFQIREAENEMTSYTSKIEYDKNGDLVFGKFLYVTSDICTTTGNFILPNTDYEIMTDDVYSFDKELSKAIDSIFVSFKSNVELISSKLLDIKNCT